MRRTALGPAFVLLFLSGTFALIGGTDYFDPVMNFIHGRGINPAGAAACLFFTIFGFAAYYCLLSVLFAHFIPRLDGCENSGHRKGFALQVPEYKINTIKKGGMNATN